MKKIICLSLIAVLCLSLCGCGAGMVKLRAADAPVLDLNEMTALLESDPSAAKKEYHGNIYRVTGEIVFTDYDDNDEDLIYYFIGYNQYNPVYDYYESHYLVKIPINRNDHESFSQGEIVTFAGVLSLSGSIPELHNAIVLET